MGNCCCPTSSTDDNKDTTTNHKAKTKQKTTTNSGAFPGEGHRLGSVGETSNNNTNSNNNNNNNHGQTIMVGRGCDNVIVGDDDIPEPIIYNDNLTPERREQIRAERAAAAEARIQKLTGGGGGTKKGKKNDNNNNNNSKNNEPLRGPNSRPTMTWTAGGL